MAHSTKPTGEGGIHGDDAGDMGAGAAVAALQVWLCPLSTGAQGQSGRGLGLNFLIVSTVWLQAPGTQTGGCSMCPRWHPKHPPFKGVQYTEQRPRNQGSACLLEAKSPTWAATGVQSNSVQTQTGRWGWGKGWVRPSPPFPTPPSACPLQVRSPVVRVERLRSLAAAWVWFTVGREPSSTVSAVRNHSDCNWVGAPWAGAPTCLGKTPDQPLPRTCHLYSEQGPQWPPTF